MKRNGWIGSSILLVIIAALFVILAGWKYVSIRKNNAASANQPEPIETVTVAPAKERLYRQTTTSIGTITAVRFVTLQNEVAGTVRQVLFSSGQIVDPGALLVSLDVSVEQAELKEQQARAVLARTQLERMQSVSKNGAISESEIDRSKAEMDVALAQVARTKAIIGRKMIRAPFRARVGISDIHPGQYLTEGTQITTLQGVDEEAYVDFAVTQQVAANLHAGDHVQVFAENGSIQAEIVAADARIDPNTRNEMLRAKIHHGPAPGASVRVEVPAGPERSTVAVPVNALRKGPQGDHVFVIAPDKEGKPRAHLRQVEGGTIIGDEVLILSGLSHGEQVASSGSFKLRDSSLVTISSDSRADASQ
jgi:membrane fusion protein (multidrug efflux system)